jgi:magnesium chelatase subunit I
MNINKKIYPFTAIVGQEKMKLALILNIINPSLGGVLIRGKKVLPNLQQYDH